MSTTAFVLQDTQKVPYSIAAVDKDNNPTSLPSGDSILAASADPTVASVVADATPTAGSVASGFIVGQSKLGTVQISFTPVGSDGTTPDASIAPGAVSIQVVAGAAASLAPTLGTPVSQ